MHFGHAGPRSAAQPFAALHSGARNAQRVHATHRWQPECDALQVNISVLNPRHTSSASCGRNLAQISVRQKHTVAGRATFPHGSTRASAPRGPRCAAMTRHSSASHALILAALLRAAKSAVTKALA